jgi:hypothetical protein
MIGTWRRFLALGWRERRLLIALLVALPVLRIALRRWGYTRTRAAIERWTARYPKRAPSRRDLETAESLAELAKIAGRRAPLAATCLPQALAVYAVLRRRGLDPVLRIGVRKTEDRFEAHAWVELAGWPLAQPGLDHQPLPIPSPAPPGDAGASPTA